MKYYSLHSVLFTIDGQRATLVDIDRSVEGLKGGIMRCVAGGCDGIRITMFDKRYQSRQEKFFYCTRFKGLTFDRILEIINTESGNVE